MLLCVVLEGSVPQEREVLVRKVIVSVRVDFLLMRIDIDA